MRSLGPPCRSNGPGMRSLGPPRRSNGPGMRSLGPPRRSNGPGMRSLGPPCRSSGPCTRSFGPCVRANGPKVRTAKSAKSAERGRKRTLLALLALLAVRGVLLVSLAASTASPYRRRGPTRRSPSLVLTAGALGGSTLAAPELAVSVDDLAAVEQHLGQEDGAAGAGLEPLSAAGADLAEALRAAARGRLLAGLEDARAGGAGLAGPDRGRAVRAEEASADALGLARLLPALGDRRVAARAEDLVLGDLLGGPRLLLLLLLELHRLGR